jgi:hypothetical protein
VVSDPLLLGCSSGVGAHRSFWAALFHHTSGFIDEARVGDRAVRMSSRGAQRRGDPAGLPGHSTEFQMDCRVGPRSGPPRNDTVGGEKGGWETAPYLVCSGSPMTLLPFSFLHDAAS